MDAFSFVILAVAVWILMELAYRLGRLLRNNTDPAPGTDPTPQQISDLHAQDRFLVRPVALKPYINELAQILDQIRENGDVQIFPASFLAALFRPVGELWRCLHEISQISPKANKYEIHHRVRGLPPRWDGKQNTHRRARGIDRQSCGTTG